jgi:biotin carboxyl carrier protein
MDKREENEFGFLNINSRNYKTRLSRKFVERKPYTPADPKLVLSFIPGTVLEILVKEGQTVTQGQDLMILDAMKMQNRLKCQADGKIKRIAVKKGSKVSKGTLLLEME